MPPEPLSRPPRVLVFDSGLGGLTVLAAADRLRPEAERLYVADDAVFPYGDLTEPDLVARALAVLDPLIEEGRPDAVVVACNTASTAVLPPLRARWPGLAVVGTVPAVKPAAAASATRRIAVLATPGTVRRDYTRDLVRRFAGDCAVDLVGAPRLATLAEAWLRGDGLDEGGVRSEVAPAFVDRDGRRTDTVVLACTHYPLLVDAFARVAPWPVSWLDPAPAIARRLDAVLGAAGFPSVPSAPVRPGRVVFTSGRHPGPALARALLARGLEPA
ncbi:glutamate racemase [Lichenibacterium dinghuense]|uniref:glutamate racemase n=1 Tax=Lichenibacterium dinghuense TaxID=2895977 RepID=UPI001F025350|nr:glutamate racemase [Lichenibacterium sp. 6Y81]